MRCAFLQVTFSITSGSVCSVSVIALWPVQGSMHAQPLMKTSHGPMPA
jgi:hypothetical protein